MRNATMLVAILAFVPLASATAQVRQPPVERGARIRIRVTGPSELSDRGIVGTVASWETKQLVLDPEKPYGTLTFPIDSIIKLEISRGKKSKVGMGLTVGGIVGSLTGVVLFMETQCPRDQIPPICLDPEIVDGEAEALLTALLGMGAGALIGSRVRTDRWEEVPVSQLRVSFGPQPDGRFGLGALVRF